MMHAADQGRKNIMSQEFYYIIQGEGGERIVEYPSHVAPPEIGAILDLTNITSDHELVQVMGVDQTLEEDHTLAKVKVTRVTRPAGWHGVGNPI
jgi:hypothetical protein